MSEVFIRLLGYRAGVVPAGDCRPLAVRLRNISAADSSLPIAPLPDRVIPSLAGVSQADADVF